MSNSMIPGPDNAGPEKVNNEQTESGDQRRSAGDQRSKKFGIPSEEECLQAIARVAGLVAMGLLKSAQANAIRAAFRDILQHHKNKAKDAHQSVSNADVMELLRKDPQLLNWLEPLLTADQVAMVMKAGEDNTDGQA